MPQTAVSEGWLNGVKNPQKATLFAHFNANNELNNWHERNREEFILKEAFGLHPIVIINLSNIPTTMIMKYTNH